MNWDQGITCPKCGETYNSLKPCGCAWRQEHYRLVQRLRDATWGPERYALIAQIKRLSKSDLGLTSAR